MGIPQADAEQQDPPQSSVSSAPSAPDANPSSQLPQAALELASKLFDMAREGNNDVLSQYLSAGIPANMTNHSGDTLLMLASYYGHPSTVSLLLSKSADPNVVNGKGQTPLAGAVFKDYVEVVKILAEGGADPEKGQPSAVETAGMFKREDCGKAMGVELEEGGGAGGVEGAREATMRRLATQYAARVNNGAGEWDDGLAT